VKQNGSEDDFDLVPNGGQPAKPRQVANTLPLPLVMKSESTPVSAEAARFRSIHAAFGISTNGLSLLSNWM
jgi:hypothetical protein